MDSPSLRIYSKEDTLRLRYVAGIILGDILGLSWEIITDKRKLGKHPVINYSGEEVKGSFKILPDNLLFEKGISPRQIVVTDWKTIPVFFQAASDADLPFDIFAASFFLVSRYEEYLEFTPDEFGRYPAAASLSYKYGFLSIPIVDIWAKAMAKGLLKKFQSIVFKRNEYKSLITIDLDQPFAYLGKGLIRSLGGLFRDLTSSERRVSDRYNTVAKGEKDPYQVFNYITENIDSNNADARFFFPVGDYSEFDKNPSWKNDEYRQFLLSLSVKYKHGLHPSYYAAGKSSMILTESQRLNSILGNKVVLSRFHYLRLFFPQSYRDIIKAGIVEDYSMGYPEEPGFRAGIARPFYFYDVLEDYQTNLKIFPFQVMDATLYKYKHLDPVASKDLILKLIAATKNVGGLFVSIWHNTSLLDNIEWIEWRGVFEFMLKNQNHDSLS
jgi:hypothetical protein